MTHTHLRQTVCQLAEASSISPQQLMRTVRRADAAAWHSCQTSARAYYVWVGAGRCGCRRELKRIPGRVYVLVVSAGYVGEIGSNA